MGMKLGGGIDYGVGFNPAKGQFGVGINYGGVQVQTHAPITPSPYDLNRVGSRDPLGEARRRRKAADDDSSFRNNGGRTQDHLNKSKAASEAPAKADDPAAVTAKARAAVAEKAREAAEAKKRAEAEKRVNQAVEGLEAAGHAKVAGRLWAAAFMRDAAIPITISSALAANRLRDGWVLDRVSQGAQGKPAMLVLRSPGGKETREFPLDKM